MSRLNKIYEKIKKPIKLDDKLYMRLLKNNKHSSDILKMRNDPLNIRFSLTKKKIQASTHKIWIKNFLQNKNFLFMILNLKKKIGYLRLDKNKNELIISIFVEKIYREKKIGSLCLRYINLEFKKFKLVAYVIKQNKRSILFFKKNGFKISGSKKKLIII